MRLTNTIRDAFINAAMQDVPTIDYNELIQSESTRIAVELMPEKVRVVWEDPATRPFLELHRIYMRGYNYLYLPILNPDNWPESLPKEKLERLEKLNLAAAAQEKRNSELRAKLHGIAYSVATRAKLLEMLPEFEKYLPAEATTSANLPAVANVMADFVKAGWPKGEKAPA